MAVPYYLGALARPQLAGRIHQLTEALGLLWDQAQRDRRGCYECVGGMKRELIELENALWEGDRQAAEHQAAEPRPPAAQAQPFAAAVTIPAAVDQLRQAGADLSEIRSELHHDIVRALTRRGA